MKILLAALSLAVSTVVYSQNRIVSVDAFDVSYTGGLAYRHDKASGSDRDQTLFRLNLNYAENFEQYVGLMWKAKLYFNRDAVDWGSSDTLESSYGVAVGGLYNFQAEDIKNSIFVGGLVGLERAAYEFRGRDDESGWNMFLELEGGKRWDLGKYSVVNISYAPSLSMTFKRYGGDIRDEYFKSGFEIRFNFLKFDIMF